MNEKFFELLKAAQAAGQPCYVYLEGSDEALVVLSLEEYQKIKGEERVVRSEAELKAKITPEMIQENLVEEEMSPSKLLADLSKARTAKAADMDEDEFSFDSLDDLEPSPETELNAAEVLRQRTKKIAGNGKKKREGAFPGEAPDDWE